MAVALAHARALARGVGLGVVARAFVCMCACDEIQVFPMIPWSDKIVVRPANLIHISV